MTTKTKTNTSGRLIFALILLTVHLLLFVTTFTYPLVAKLFPFIVIIPALILITIETVKAFRAYREEKKASSAGQTVELRQEYMGYFWLTSVLICFFFFGIILTAFILPCIYMLLRKEPWGTIIGVTAGLGIGIYLLFIKLLKIPLYEGWILETILG